MPHLPRKVAQRPRRPNAPKRATRASPVLQVPRLPRKTKADATKCDAYHVKRRWMSPSATPATQSCVLKMVCDKVVCERRCDNVVCESRRGTWSTGLALVVRLGAGSPGAPLAWKAWHLVTSTFVSCCRRGTWGTGLALVARLGALGRPWRRATLRGRRGTW